MVCGIQLVKLYYSKGKPSFDYLTITMTIVTYLQSWGPVRGATTVRAGVWWWWCSCGVSSACCARLWPRDRVSACLGDTSRHSPTARGGAQRRTQRWQRTPGHGRRPSVENELDHWSLEWRWSNSDFKQIIIGLIVGIGAGRWPGRLYTQQWTICVCYPRYNTYSSLRDWLWM